MNWQDKWDEEKKIGRVPVAICCENVKGRKIGLEMRNVEDQSQLSPVLLKHITHISKLFEMHLKRPITCSWIRKIFTAQIRGAYLRVVKKSYAKREEFEYFENNFLHETKNGYFRSMMEKADLLKIMKNLKYFENNIAHGK